MSNQVPYSEAGSSDVIEKLRKEGFSEEQIERFKQLRSVYPLVELLDSGQQMRRLELTKWRYDNGRMGRRDLDS